MADLNPAGEREHSHNTRSRLRESSPPLTPQQDRQAALGEYAAALSASARHRANLRLSRLQVAVAGGHMITDGEFAALTSATETILADPERADELAEWMQAFMALSRTHAAQLQQRIQASAVVAQPAAAPPLPAVSVVAVLPPLTSVPAFSGRDCLTPATMFASRARAWMDRLSGPVHQAFTELDFVEALASRLTGDARRWFDTALELSPPSVATVDQFLAGLVRDQSDKDGDVKAWAAVHMASQRGRPMETYISEFSQRVAQLPPGVSGRPRTWVNDMDGFTSLFRLGLDAQYAKKLSEQPPSRDCNKDVVLDRLRAAYSAAHPTARPAVTHAAAFAVSDNGARVCFVCGDKDHVCKDCPKKAGLAKADWHNPQAFQ